MMVGLADAVRNGGARKTVITPVQDRMIVVNLTCDIAMTVFDGGRDQVDRI